jgi:hypothetical protein
MSQNFKVVMLRRNDLLHQLAIWQEVVDHLVKFLDTDALPATVGIRTDAEGMVVSQDRIEAVLNEIKNGYIAEINDELDKINKSEVAEHVKQEKRRGKKKDVIGEEKVKGGKAKGKNASRPTSTGSKSDKRKVGARKQRS